MLGNVRPTLPPLATPDFAELWRGHRFASGTVGYAMSCKEGLLGLCGSPSERRICVAMQRFVHI
jgi:hypothetical protein